MMNPVIKSKDRVRVAVHKFGKHCRNFTGTAVNFTGNGLLRVLEDGADKPRAYSLEHVRKISDPMNYGIFCLLLHANLVYEFTDEVSADMRDEWQNEWYAQYKGSSFAESNQYPDDTERVIAWLRFKFSDYSFSTHYFQLKPAEAAPAQ